MNGNGKAILGVSLFLVLVAAGMAGAGYFLLGRGPRPVEAAVAALEPAAQEADVVKLKKLCTYCHEFPAPDMFPKHAWREEIKRAFDFIRKSNIKIDGYPGLESVVAYYEKWAPPEFEKLVRLPPALHACPVDYRAEWFRPKGMPDSPGVTNVNLVHLFDEKKLDILMCHTRPGEIWVLKPYTQPPSWHLVGRAFNPCHAEVVDLDGDGHKDLIVADAGILFPTDDKVGRVLWFRGDGKGGFTPHTLLEGVGRVVDVQAAHFRDKDKLDLIVAVFGWRATGEIILLENHTTDWTKPKFVPKVLDDRPGTIHVPVVDLNGDGKPDFIACISQGTEKIVAFMNEGKGEFRMEDIFVGPHPGWGFSGIQVVDMNRDGRPDVLFSNGDILDPPFITKPYHGVQWLENPGPKWDGSTQWELHKVDGMHGTMRAYAADLDGDGDMDIVACAFLPPGRFPQRVPEKMDSVVFFEQTEPGKFARHSLEVISADHLTCIAGDLLGDGKVHLVVGNFFLSPEPNQLTESLRIWWNQGKGKAKK